MREETKKLFRITLKGMYFNYIGTSYGISYVVANNPNEAYEKVRTFLDKNDLGYSHERELDKIELIAENYRYTDTEIMLYL